MDEGVPGFRLKIWWENLTSEQKIATGILCVSGVLTMTLSATQLRAQVTAPFMAPKSELMTAQTLVGDQKTEQQILDELKNKDTDHDGISDFDEIYVYRTSSFLADTDSDGIPDAVEIANGTDPLCPEGKTCFDAINAVPGEVATTSSFEDLMATTPAAQTDASGLVGGSSSSLIGAQEFVNNPPPPEQMTPAKIRQYFLSHQLATQDQLNQLTDDQARQVYQAAYADALRIQAARSGQGAAPSVSSTKP